MFKLKSLRTDIWDEDTKVEQLKFKASNLNNFHYNLIHPMNRLIFDSWFHHMIYKHCIISYKTVSILFYNRLFTCPCPLLFAAQVRCFILFQRTKSSVLFRYFLIICPRFFCDFYFLFNELFLFIGRIFLFSPSFIEIQ